ncbi:hypothetical protein BC830DRAFT_1171949 [Chytriomyces sp. MP71]|nr:hypothetical protein BC830DRAFT_1171949 [Chytriomyces sp. MP71]
MTNTQQRVGVLGAISTGTWTTITIKGLNQGLEPGGDCYRAVEDEHGPGRGYPRNPTKYKNDLDGPGYGSVADYPYDGYYDVDKDKRKRCCCIPTSKEGRIICGVRYQFP